MTHPRLLGPLVHAHMSSLASAYWLTLRRLYVCLIDQNKASVIPREEVPS